MRRGWGLAAGMAMSSAAKGEVSALGILRGSIWGFSTRWTSRSASRRWPADVATAEVLVGGGHDLLLGDGGEAVDFAAGLGPGAVLEEAVAEQFDALLIVLEAAFEADAVVGDDGGEQPVLELARADLGDLLEQEFLDLLQALAFLGGAVHELGPVVVEDHGVGARLAQALGLVEVEVNEAGGAVVEQHVDELAGGFVGMAAGDGAEAEQEVGLAGEVD